MKNANKQNKSVFSKWDAPKAVLIVAFSYFFIQPIFFGGTAQADNGFDLGRYFDRLEDKIDALTKSNNNVEDELRELANEVQRMNKSCR